MDKSIFNDLFQLGYFPLPLLWDADKKEAIKHPEHDTNAVEISLEYVQGLLKNGFSKANGVALKLKKPLIFLDFDEKNAKTNKNVYDQWFKIIEASAPDVLRKVCIESTKSNGFHVYAKFDNIESKMTMARNNEGHEVISVYAGELLSYCYPTPGYKLIHNDFNDIDFLTQQEFDLFVSTAALFNEDKEFIPGTPLKLIDYPLEYENLLLQFDRLITDEVFDKLLNRINLFHVKEARYKKYKWEPYLRKGSVAAYSAKVYFWSKRVLLFTASMPGYPNWHDSSKMGDDRWVLSPSRILFYKNSRSWPDVATEIRMINDSADLGITEVASITDRPIISEDRLKFPYDVFPENIQNFIFSQVIQHEYLAGGILSAVSTCIGNSAVLEAMDGYTVKPILYMAVVAPPGASKTPALKKTFAPIEKHDAGLHETFSVALDEWKQTIASLDKDKKSEKPERPAFPQTLIKDSTIEMVVKILSQNPIGCCVFADELVGFLKRMNKYKEGDDIQKWLEMWSGSPLLVQRVNRDENRVQEPFCNILGGIQPGVLESLSKQDNEHNGFYHRFLFIYPEPKKKADWQQIEVPYSVKQEYNDVFETLIKMRTGLKTMYLLNEDSNLLYGEWFNKKNHKYNKSTNDQTKGVIAKYQDYCLRFALIIQVLYDSGQRLGIITKESMERAIRLTEYFLGNMHKAMQILSPETPADKLQGVYRELYDNLPNAFSTKSMMEIGRTLKIKDGSIKTFFFRNKALFNEIEKGKYEKNF